MDNRSSVAIYRRDALGEEVDDPRSLVSDDLPNSPLRFFLAFGKVGECWMEGFSLKLGLPGLVMGNGDETFEPGKG